MPLTAGRIEAFATSWRACRARHSLAWRLEKFSDEVRPLLRRKIFPPPLAVLKLLSVDRLECVSAELRPMIAARAERGNGINIWDAAGLGLDERRNVGVLAQLWTPTSLGRLSFDFLTTFLSRVKGAEGINLERGYHVHTEHRPTGDGAHRVDLVIETRELIIGVEAKIRAPADAKQLARYEAELRARAAHKGPSCNYKLIFLGPWPRSFDCALSSTWDDVATAARDTARRSNGTSRRLLRDFAIYISKFGK